MSKRYLSVYRSDDSFKNAFEEIGIPPELYSWLDDKTIRYERRLNECVNLLLHKGWEIIFITKGAYGEVCYHFLLQQN